MDFIVSPSSPTDSDPWPQPPFLYFSWNDSALTVPAQPHLDGANSILLTACFKPVPTSPKESHCLNNHLHFSSIHSSVLLSNVFKPLPFLWNFSTFARTPSSDPGFLRKQKQPHKNFYKLSSQVPTNLHLCPNTPHDVYSSYAFLPFKEHSSSNFSFW